MHMHMHMYTYHKYVHDRPSDPRSLVAFVRLEDVFTMEDYMYAAARLW